MALIRLNKKLYCTRCHVNDRFKDYIFCEYCIKHENEKTKPTLKQLCKELENKKQKKTRKKRTKPEEKYPQKNNLLNYYQFGQKKKAKKKKQQIKEISEISTQTIKKYMIYDTTLTQSNFVVVKNKKKCYKCKQRFYQSNMFVTSEYNKFICKNCKK